LYHFQKREKLKMSIQRPASSPAFELNFSQAEAKIGLIYMPLDSGLHLEKYVT
jgi:hypothetical protein